MFDKEHTTEEANTQKNTKAARAKVLCSRSMARSKWSGIGFAVRLEIVCASCATYFTIELLQVVKRRMMDGLVLTGSDKKIAGEQNFMTRDVFLCTIVKTRFYSRISKLG